MDQYKIIDEYLQEMAQELTKDWRNKYGEDCEPITIKLHSVEPVCRDTVKDIKANRTYKSNTNN